MVQFDMAGKTDRDLRQLGRHAPTDFLLAMRSLRPVKADARATGMDLKAFF